MVFGTEVLKKFFIAMTFIVASGCQPTPSEYLVPKPSEEKVIVDKEIKNIFVKPAIDILFIIDDSGSMSTFQQLLAQNSFEFIDKFLKTKFVDYHIGVTTSSEFDSSSVAGDGRLHWVDSYLFVDRKTVNPSGILARMMNVGTSGSASERFLNISTLTLESSLSGGFNKGFYRPNAQLAIFVLTDTEDQSSYTPERAFEYLLNLKLGDEKKLFYAGALAQQSANCSGEFQYPNKLIKMIKLHEERGFLFDLCSSSYGEELALVAEDLVSSVSRIYLQETPVASTIRVVYGQAVIPNDSKKGWVYDPIENAIILSAGIEIVDPSLADLNIQFEAVY